MAIARATGASFPLATGQTGTVSSVTSASFSTNEATTRIIVCLSSSNAIPTAQHPWTVAWNGGTPAGATAFTALINQGSPSSNYHASVWVAECTQALSGVSVLATATASSTAATASLVVDALVNASAGTGATDSANWAVSTAANRTINNIKSGSWIYVAAGLESVSAVTNITSPSVTTEIDERTDATGPTVSAIGVNTAGNSGNIQVGWTTSTTWGSIALAEILEAPIVSDTVIVSDAVSMYGPVAFAPTTVFQASAFQHVGAFQILAGDGGAPGPSWTVSDTVTASDAAQIARVGAVSATDTVTTSDQIALSRQSTASVSDSVTVSDDAQIARRAALSASDTVTTSDAAQIARVGAVSVSDTVTTSDQALLGRVGGLEVSDTVTTFDDVAIATETGATFATTDTVVTSDAIALARALSLGCSDTVTVTDDVAMQRAAGGQLTVTDVVSVTDAVAIARAAVLQISDTVTVTDAVVASGAPTPPVVTSRKTGDWIPWWMRHKSRSLRRWK